MSTNNSDLKKEKTTQVVENANENVAEVKETVTETIETKVAETKIEEKKTETEVAKEEKETVAPPAPPAEALASKRTTTVTTTPKAEPKPLELKNLDIDFVFDVLSVPTKSHSEYRMVAFIVLWARTHGIKCEYDDYGNVYLTKGELAEGEYYPCVTSHLDTVQDGQELYAQLGIPLKLEERINSKGGHELYVKGTGIGADDKAGVLISLSLFEHFDKLKACFFLEEEVGCCGSKNLKKEWFDNVGYVIGWDSPDRNRAAYACSGELLFGKDFFELIEDTCKENGVTNFNSEPFTDVKEIRSKTEVVCMNFGNGGYDAHRSTEYVIIEDIDASCGLGIALIKKLGMQKFRMKSKGTYAYGVNTKQDEDAEWLRKKFDKYPSYGGYGGSSYTSGYSYQGRGTNTTTSSTSTTSTKNSVSVGNEDKVSSKVLEHVVNRYEQYISDIELKCESREETILQGIKKLCADGVTDYAMFLELFTENPSSEPFSTAIEF